MSEEKNGTDTEALNMPRDDESFRNWIANHIRETQTALANGDARMSAIEGRVSGVEAELQKNTEATQRVDARTERIDKNTEKIVEIWGNLESGFKFINWTGQAVEWLIKKAIALSIFAAACYGAWLAFVQSIKDQVK